MFTTEQEKDRSLLFLDVMMIRNNDGTMSHKVYKKKTHANQYLHASSHHHPSQKVGILNMLIAREIRISNKDHL